MVELMGNCVSRAAFHVHTYLMRNRKQTNYSRYHDYAYLE